MKFMLRKTAALLLCFAIVLCLLPGSAFAADEDIYTIYVEDVQGNAVSGASVSGAYKWFFGSPTSIDASKIFDNGDGSYTVYVDNHYSNDNYTFTWTASYDGCTPVSVQFPGSQRVITITLPIEAGETEPEVTEPEETEPEETEPSDARWVSFDMYYYLKGNETNPFPPTYAGTVDIGQFGPSGDNTPFATITVDLNKLETEYSDVIVYQENLSDNFYHYIPSTETPAKEDAERFWEAVVACMSEETLLAYQASGLADIFVGYVLKSMTGGEFHCDGYLQVVPPVYSIELYRDTVPDNDEAAGEANANYVGGLVTGNGETHKTKKDILDALEVYLNQNITWNEDENGNPIETDGKFTGTYIDGHTVYTVTIYQSSLDLSSPDLQTVEGSDIPYVKKSNTYFLARFILDITSRQIMDYTVTYTDGDANGTAFYNHSYGVTHLEGETETVPPFPHAPHRDGYTFLGWKMRGSDDTLLTTEQIAAMIITEDLIFDAQWEASFRVVFHTNNASAENEDEFRVYYAPNSQAPAGALLLNAGKVDVFYDIPTFAYNVHNGYIFMGWYLGTEETAAVMDWDAVYTSETHIYAHWIEVGTVSKEEDGKIYKDSFYPEYDLLGNQIRTSVENPGAHYGDAAPGLRFITSLSERVYQQMNALHENNAAGIEYGVLIARADMANAMLKYKHSSINGEDTTVSHSFVNNVPCRVAGVPVDDHYSGEQYRLYTAVITYKNLEGDKLTQAQNTYFIGRAYLRYYDANGLERAHYNNYTGDSQTYGGVNTCYQQVVELLNAQ